MRIFDLHVFTTKQLNRLKSDIRAASNKQVGPQWQKAKTTN